MEKLKEFLTSELQLIESHADDQHRMFLMDYFSINRDKYLSVFEGHSLSEINTGFANLASEQKENCMAMPIIKLYLYKLEVFIKDYSIEHRRSRKINYSTSIESYEYVRNNDKSSPHNNSLYTNLYYF